ncbi:hypothetical protein [Thermosulfurimonas dismutans]|uniref:Uncharacterized protein n=1 Tax=Thermosulfurimonas dismutans TaxID=999894 RepID=A0A179D1U1_9BACT|nr:hypothetical protein [Thermosulfurimonas dismutans]OAQ20035.1 hypothetical protein TDIS_1854 [Thermosulfurimonas dismutans]
MLEYSFRSLPYLVLSLRRNSQNYIMTIPSIDILSSIDSILRILLEIYNSYKSDIKMNKKLIEKFPAIGVKESKLESFIAREIWRIGSFIVFALNLTDILKKEYKNMHDKIGDEVNKKILKQREDAIKKYRRYRHKIFAHTAFASPKKKEDNCSMQVTSLKYFCGHLIGFTQQGIMLGGAKVVIGNEDCPNFEQLTFDKMVTDFHKYFGEWYEIYYNRCVELLDYSEEDIKTRISDSEILYIRKNI